MLRASRFRWYGLGHLSVQLMVVGDSVASGRCGNYKSSCVVPLDWAPDCSIADGFASGSGTMVEINSRISSTSFSRPAAIRSRAMACAANSEARAP